VCSLRPVAWLLTPVRCHAVTRSSIAAGDDGTCQMELSARSFGPCRHTVDEFHCSATEVVLTPSKAATRIGETHCAVPIERCWLGQSAPDAAFQVRQAGGKYSPRARPRWDIKP
jgi:hypothetical protein